MNTHTHTHAHLRATAPPHDSHPCTCPAPVISSAWSVDRPSVSISNFHKFGWILLIWPKARSTFASPSPRRIFLTSAAAAAQSASRQLWHASFLSGQRGVGQRGDAEPGRRMLRLCEQSESRGEVKCRGRFTKTLRRFRVRSVAKQCAADGGCGCPVSP